MIDSVKEEVVVIGGGFKGPCAPRATSNGYLCGQQCGQQCCQQDSRIGPTLRVGDDVSAKSWVCLSHNRHNLFCF